MLEDSSNRMVRVTFWCTISSSELDDGVLGLVLGIMGRVTTFGTIFAAYTGPITTRGPFAGVAAFFESGSVAIRVEFGALEAL